MIAMATPASATGSLNDAHGVTCSIAVNVPTVDYADGSGNHWSGNANWFGIAWSAPQQSNVHTAGPGKFLIISTPSGKLAFGMGTITAGMTIPLPPGFQWKQTLDDNTSVPTALGFAGPASFVDSGNHLHGIQLCTVDENGNALLVYADGEGHQWSGNVNYCAFAWS